MGVMAEALTPLIPPILLSAAPITDMGHPITEPLIPAIVEDMVVMEDIHLTEDIIGGEEQPKLGFSLPAYPGPSTSPARKAEEVTRRITATIF